MSTYRHTSTTVCVSISATTTEQREAREKKRREPKKGGKEARRKSPLPFRTYTGDYEK
jgi:hypothetical protein